MKRDSDRFSTSVKPRSGKGGLVSAVVATVSLVGAAACAKSGSGVGIAQVPGQAPQEVPFVWESGSESLSGDIAATLPDGETYQGRFLELTSESVAPHAGNYWAGWGWDHGWGWGWGYGGPSWVTEYSGVVVAQLSSDRGNTMRCIFRLEDPAAGLAGGGLGRCQTSEGVVIENATVGEGQEAWARRPLRPTSRPSG